MEAYIDVFACFFTPLSKFLPLRDAFHVARELLTYSSHTCNGLLASHFNFLVFLEHNCDLRFDQRMLGRAKYFERRQKKKKRYSTSEHESIIVCGN